ncbi:MAG TPA: dihydrodipicolinate synthase family protein [Gemmatimonadaceae bacterium]
MKIQLQGIIGPVVTPFDPETGELAPVAFKANLRSHMAVGLSGVLVAGSTGEAALLDEGERLQLVEWARTVVPDDRILLVGTGAESTRATIARTRAAAERGADAVLVVPPHYFGPAMTPDALATHFCRVADESPVPVLLYNMPKYTHITFEPDLVHELSKHGNIAGMKDSAGDVEHLRGYVGAQSEHFTVLTGHAGALYAALEMGARGAVLAVSLFAGPLALEVYSAFADGDMARAGRAQTQLQGLNKEIVGTLGVAGVKAAMDLAGLRGGPTRAPLLALRAKEREHVAQLLSAADIARAA